MTGWTTRIALFGAALITFTFGSPERLALLRWSARLSSPNLRGMQAAERPSTAEAQEMPNTLAAKEKADGWRLLFDGKTTAGWRGFRQQTMPGGWQAVDGALTRVGQAGDIVTVDEFGDFELKIGRAHV